MTQEDKELLFKDLCMRLPYGVIMTNKKFTETHYPLTCEDLRDAMFDESWDDVPYLRPMTSMTEKEKDYVEELSNFRATPDIVQAKVDFYMEHFINYRLPDNLFIEAPEGMYNIKN